MKTSSIYGSFGALLLTVTGLAHGQTIKSLSAHAQNINLGQPVFLTVAFDGQSEKCGLRFDMGNGQLRDVRVGDNGAADFPFHLAQTYSAPGSYTVKVVGQDLRRGLRSVSACPGESKSISVTIEDPALVKLRLEAEQRRAETEQYRKRIEELEQREAVAVRAREAEAAKNRELEAAAANAAARQVAPAPLQNAGSGQLAQAAQRQPNAAAPAPAQSCPTTFAHLEAVLPTYQHPQLLEVRTQVINSNVAAAYKQALAKVKVPAKAVSAADQDLKSAEQQYRAAASCLSQTFKNVPQRVSDLESGAAAGPKDASMDNCSQIYVLSYYGLVAMRETASVFACLAQQR